MMCFVVEYASSSGRKRTILVLAKSFDDAKKIAENYFGDSKNFLGIRYVTPASEKTG